MCVPAARAGSALHHAVYTYLIGVDLNIGLLGPVLPAPQPRHLLLPVPCDMGQHCPAGQQQKPSRRRRQVPVNRVSRASELKLTAAHEAMWCARRPIACILLQPLHVA